MVAKSIFIKKVSLLATKPAQEISQSRTGVDAAATEAEQGAFQAQHTGDELSRLSELLRSLVKPLHGVKRIQQIQPVNKGFRNNVSLNGSRVTKECKLLRVFNNHLI